MGAGPGGWQRSAGGGRRQQQQQQQHRAWHRKADRQDSAGVVVAGGGGECTWRRFGQAALRKRWARVARCVRVLVWRGRQPMGREGALGGFWKARRSERCARRGRNIRSSSGGGGWGSAVAGTGARTYPVNAQRRRRGEGAAAQSSSEGEERRRSRGRPGRGLSCASGQMRSSAGAGWRARFVEMGARCYFWRAGLARPPADGFRWRWAGSTRAAGRRKRRTCTGFPVLCRRCAVDEQPERALRRRGRSWPATPPCSFPSSPARRTDNMKHLTRRPSSAVVHHARCCWTAPPWANAYIAVLTSDSQTCAQCKAS